MARHESGKRIGLAMNALFTVVAITLLTADKRPATEMNTWMDPFQQYMLLLRRGLGGAICRTGTRCRILSPEPPLSRLRAALTMPAFRGQTPQAQQSRELPKAG